MLAALKSAAGMIKTKYVNRTTIIAAVSSVTTYLMLKFVDAPISELAKETWAAVKRLLF